MVAEAMGVDLLTVGVTVSGVVFFGGELPFILESLDASKLSCFFVKLLITDKI